MHTLGAIVLSFIAALTMQFLLGYVTQFLFPLMLGSVGVFLPAVLGIAFTACTYFGGVYFALTLIPGSNARTVANVLIGFAIVVTIYQIAKALDAGAPGIVVVFMAVGCAASVAGAWIARTMVESERQDVLRHGVRE